MEQCSQIYLHKKAFLSDITALQIWEDHLLRVLFTGVGPFLKVFCLRSGDLLFSSCVLETSVIHGIDVIAQGENLQVAVFGQRIVKVLEAKAEKSQFSIQSILPFANLSDWVLDARFWQTSFLAIGCSHNQIQIWDWKHQTLVATCQHPENSILYSLSFMTAIPNELIIACGNVSNQILVWKICADSNYGVEQINCLVGHQGIPFRLRWVFSETWNLLSAADDRTLRFWRNVLVCASSEDPSTVMYGHQARVWDCLATNSFIVSCGEDNTCRVWSFDGKQISVFTGHDGKNVRTIAITKDGTVLASGGGDSRIKLWNLKNMLKADEGNKLVWDLPLRNNKEDSPRCVAFSESARGAFVACASGRIYKFSIGNLDPPTFIDLDSFKVHSMKAMNNLLILGDSSGFIKVVDFINQGHKELLLCRAHSKSVAEIFPFEFSTTNISFCTSSVDGLFKLWMVNENDFNLPQVASVDLVLYCKQNTKAREHSISSMKAVQTAGEKYIFLGDTSGNILLFQLQYKMDGISLEMVHTEFGAHNNGNRVSDILITPKASNGWNIYSAGRDGTINQFSFHERSFCKVATFTTAFEIIDSLHFREDQLYAMGFVGSNMILTNVTLNYNKLNIDCGGHKRSFDFFFSKEQRNSEVDHAFIFVNKKKIVLVHNTVNTENIPVENLHTQFHGLQSLSILPLEMPVKNKGIQFVTTGEDAKLKLFSMSTEQEYQLCCQQTVLAHSASIKCVTSCSDVMFTAGSYSELKAFRIHRNECGEVMSFVEIPLLWKKSELHKEPRNRRKHIRIMDVKAFQISEGVFCVMTARSDSLIKVFVIDQSGQITCVGNGDFHNCAVLCLEYLTFNQQHYLFSGGTDGVLFLSNISSLLSNSVQENMEITPLQQMKVHQLGLNCLVQSTLGTKHILICGGDDQKLALVCFDNHQMTEMTFCVAHNTAITAVQTLGNFIFTAGTDQRLHIWKFDSEHLIKLATCCLELADIADMIVVAMKPKIVILVVGCGLQILEVEGIQ